MSRRKPIHTEFYSARIVHTYEDKGWSVIPRENIGNDADTEIRYLAIKLENLFMEKLLFANTKF